MAELSTYRAKRRFGVTAEPKGKIPRQRGQAYVIQKHSARRLHYDLRLELDGVMKSWALTRGPSLVPGEKRLAVQVEDHPIAYNAFEGTIPKGEYGAGSVMLWDRGTWQADGDPHKGLEKGRLSFRLDGEKLHGGWHLVRVRRRNGESRNNWLLIKQHDAYERSPSDKDILEEKPLSVLTGRSLDEIAAGAARKSKNRQLNRRPASLPRFVPPCLATFSRAAPGGDRWLHEIKFDGYRLQAQLDRGEVRLMTRRGLDWTKKFPSIATAVARLPAQQALLDGEAVVLGENGVSSFSLLQQALKTGDDARIVYCVFDMMHLDGRDLTSLPLAERQEILSHLLARVPKDGALRVSLPIDRPGPDLLDAACKMGLEGIVSKRRDAPYHSGRRTDWLKTKCTDRQEFVVAGFAPSTADTRAVGALVLGYYERGRLRYAGRTGTGFTHSTARIVYHTLAPLAVKRSPIAPVPKEERGAHAPIWVRPKIVVEVEFRGWTHGGRVRQASFQGVREDKPAKEIVRERKLPPLSLAETKTKRRTSVLRRAVGTSGVKVGAVALSHPDRVYWPDAGITKLDLARYYEKVWKWMRPHIVGRPLTLLRCPEGAGAKKCFFQKHAHAGIADEFLHLVPEKSGTTVSVADLDGLISLVQAGVLEFHVRGSTIEHLDKADRLVFDLDPGPDVEWSDVVAAAGDLRERLAGIDLTTFVKTSGGKGLHVVVPIAPAPWDVVQRFARTVATAMAADAPERYVATSTKARRHGRIFIDYLRNSREATTVAPYSTRAREGAPVSMPVAWSELGALKSARQYTMRNAINRLSRVRKDPWGALGRIKQALPKFK